MARRVAPEIVAHGWGRIINVTTKLDTMNRPHTSPYGASKAALEMATEVWAKEVEGSGLTVNIVVDIPTLNALRGTASSGSTACARGSDILLW